MDCKVPGGTSAIDVRGGFDPGIKKGGMENPYPWDNSLCSLFSRIDQLLQFGSKLLFRKAGQLVCSGVLGAGSRPPGRYPVVIEAVGHIAVIVVPKKPPHRLGQNLVSISTEAKELSM